MKNRLPLLFVALLGGFAFSAGAQNVSPVVASQIADFTEGSTSLALRDSRRMSVAPTAVL